MKNKMTRLAILELYQKRELRIVVVWYLTDEDDAQTTLILFFFFFFVTCWIQGFAKTENANGFRIVSTKKLCNFT